MRLYLRLAWRNVWRHRRRTLIVVLAIGLTTALMMLYDGLIAGFDQAIYGNAVKVLGGNAQIHAEGYQARTDQTPLLPLVHDQALVDAAQARSEVLAATRRINTGGMVSNREGAFAVSIVGIEPERELSVNLVLQKVIQGRSLTADDRDLVLIGKGLADAMSAQVGDRVTLVGRAAHQQMRQRTMTLAGVYDIGMPDIEKRTIYLSLGAAQGLYAAPGQCTEVVLWLAQLGQEGAVIEALAPDMSGYELTSWEANFPELVQTLATKGAVMDVFGIIMLLISSIGLFNLLLMAVFERTREIGLLGALGLKPRQISLLFVLEGALMGLVGSLVGVGLGLAFNGVMSQVGFDYSQFTSLTSYSALIDGRIYSTLAWDSIPQHALTAVIIATLASFYPAHQAASREPAAALHYV